MSDEPLLCPFCGGKPFIYYQEEMINIEEYCIECTKCSCSTPWVNYKEDVIEIWNRRYEPTK
jgi:Lar family restriction alleviation protein